MSQTLEIVIILVPFVAGGLGGRFVKSIPGHSGLGPLGKMILGAFSGGFIISPLIGFVRLPVNGMEVSWNSYLGIFAAEFIFAAIAGWFIVFVASSATGHRITHWHYRPGDDDPGDGGDIGGGDGG